ncbi:hypothetical protein BH09PAT4_BH09PAT4_01170 [soil metagenome]
MATINNGNSQPGKDTVYVDVDDEITSIIDKVRAGDGRIVALVLPKRATVLQSIVNMKLLKRSAEQAKKQLVLITTEAGLLPLAGTVGLHVADTLQSKPEIPVSPVVGGTTYNDDEALSLDDEPEEEFTAENAGDKPVGDLASKAGKGGLVITSGVETETPLAATASPSAAKTAANPAKKPNKKLAVPNFNKFRLRLVLAGVALLALIGLIYAAMVILPKATVTITTNAQDVNSSIGFSLDTGASSLDVATANVPATAVQQQKTYTKEVATTGQQNNGKKATGSIVMTICTNDSTALNDIPPGTGVTTNSLTFITQDNAHFQYDSPCGGGKFRFTTSSVSITAQSGGANYNVSNASFTVNGRSDISASGSSTGGTDDITKVVAQKDIETAKNQVDTKDPAIKEALNQQLIQNGLFPISVTFQASDPTVSSSAQPGDKADKVTVTVSITYTMFGTAKSNLAALIKDDVGQQVDIEKQTISDDGLDKATFSIKDVSDTKARLTMESVATVGPKIDKEAIKNQIAGHKSGEAKDTISQLPGVTDVNIKLGPFWVSSIPKSTDKIVIQVDKAGTSN